MKIERKKKLSAFIDQLKFDTNKRNFGLSN